MDKLKRIVFFLREFFFQQGCALCGQPCTSLDETWYGLCDDCRARIERELAETRAMEACEYCGKPLISERERCLCCRRRTETPAFDRAIVLFPYSGKYQKLLASYKFDRHIALGNFFTEIIRKTLEEKGIPVETGIIPVPPRPGKLRNTGWDQVEHLARLLEKDKDCVYPVIRHLKRLRSKSQKELSRKNRQTNMKGRITSKIRPPKTAVIIDDVITTGSTLDACAKALKENGAQTVYALCLFYD
jgi:ComF family protein